MDGQAEKQGTLSLVKSEEADEHKDVGNPDGAVEAELAKWRERVPKLAAALRDKTAEVETLKQNYLKLSDDANIKAGTDAIERVSELEVRNDRQSRELEEQADLLEQLRSEHDAWKEKCEKVSHLLDGQTEEMSIQRALAERAEAVRAETQDHLDAASDKAEQLHTQVETLTSRNAQLSETIDMANQQIAALGEDLARLTDAELENEKSAGIREELETRNAEYEALQAQMAHQQEAAAEAQKQFADLEKALESAQQTARQAEDECLSAQKAARDKEDALKCAQDDAQQLKDQLVAAEAELEAQAERMRAEFNQLADQNLDMEQTLTSENSSLKEQLEEMTSASTRMDHKFRVLSSKFIQSRDELKTLSDERESLVQANSRLRFDENELNAAIQAAVDEARKRFEREFSEQLELADIQQQKLAELATTVEERDEEIQRLGNCIGDAEQANRLRETERELLSTQLTQTRSRLAKIESHLDESVELIAKLEAENADLKASMAEAVSRTEQPVVNRPTIQVTDDFTKIKGIGPKLAMQLHHLGVVCYEDIAAIDESEISNASHELHTFYSRMQRDEWISQADALIEAKNQ
jgi:predicted flap endonuclease-1-like 5' DNA nuclease/outer membrane murein-binding lipoprotein Lpp